MHIDPTNDPKTWENYIKDVLRRHYGPAHIKDIPDAHGGDFGIECYTFSGHAFQCFLPEQTVDKKKLAEAQKAKIRSDLKKFSVTNVLKFEQLFAGMKISRWVLVTPSYSSSEMALYCSKKSLELREIGLPYIADDFEVLIQTEGDYKSEVRSLKQDIYQLSLKFDSVDKEHADTWINTNLAFLEKLDIKLPKVVPEGKVDQTKNMVVLKYLEFQNLLEHLRVEWSDIYATVVRLISNRRSYLEGRFLTDANKQPNEVIMSELEGLEKDIGKEIPTLKSADLKLITWGVVADWLIRCPLDF